MKLDRNIPENRGRGKYALLLLRKIDDPKRDVSTYRNYAIRIWEALRLLEEVGILDWGNEGTESEFFVMRLKDRFSASGLSGYADAASAVDPEYAREVYGLAGRSGPNNPFCKLPD
jgi:hypothetical protein